MKGNQQQREARIAEILDLRVKGLTYREVGQYLGISGQRVQQILRPSKDVWLKIRKRAGGKCGDCGMKIENGHVHHIESKHEGFNESINLVYLCIGCHRLAHCDKGGQSRSARKLAAVRENGRRRKNQPGTRKEK